MMNTFKGLIRMTRNHDTGRTGLRTARNVSVAALCAIGLSGCIISPKPFSASDTQMRVAMDLSAMFADQEPLTKPLTVHEAMARAIAYNLEARLRVMEHALSQRQIDSASMEMLPRMAADAGFVGRDNVSAASSESLISRRQSLEPSTSQDRNKRVADLNVVWNVLDFGVSWIGAEQQADRSLIAEERRRKVIHNITQDVRSAYWRAAAAERLLGRIDRLMVRIRQAQASSAEMEQSGMGDPLEALTYRRALVDSLRQLETQRKELALARTELSALINLPPGSTLRLAASGAPLRARLASEPQRMEELALALRPELREEDYQVRISSAEGRKALLSLLPGLQLSGGAHADSNSFLVNNNWADYGLKVTWNLLRLFSGPAVVAAAEAGEDVAVARRRALTMAVLAQVHVARADYADAHRQYRHSVELDQLDRQILAQLRNRETTGSGGELATIQAELSALQSALRMDLAAADLRNAFGRIHVTVGADPLPQILEGTDIATLARSLAETEARWSQGEVASPAQEMVAVAQAPRS
jgi:outer membrane protein, multidrug efflux system